MLLSHLSVRSSGLAGVVGYDPKVVSTSQGPITLRSHLVPGVLNRLLHSGADRARVEALAVALATETSLEENIYHLCNSNPAQCSIEGLEKAVTFYRAYPSWWEQTVESRFEAQAEGLRAQIHDKWDLVEFDIGVGVAKGGYQFAKGTVVGIYDLMRLAYSLCTSTEDWVKAGELVAASAAFYGKIQFGSPEQRSQALQEAKQFAQTLIDHISSSIKQEWAKAESQGREKELAAKWATQGILEIATLLLAVVKGARAAKIAGEAADSAQLASKIPEVKTLTKAAIALETGIRPSIALGRRLFPGRSERFYRDFAKIQGTVVGAYDRYSAGNLPAKAAQSFSGSRYVEIVLDRPLRAYRVWAPETDAIEMGRFWGLTRPRGSLGARFDHALLPQWGGLLRDERIRSQATRVIGRELSAGQTILVGESASQGGIWHGGSAQILIEDLSLPQGTVFFRGELK